MNIQERFPLGLTGLISLLPRDSRESSLAPQFKIIHYLVLSLLYGPTLTSVRDYWKNHSFYCTDLCPQSDVSAFTTPSRFVIAFLPRSKCPLISWLQSPSSVILEPKKIKSVTASTFSPSICHHFMANRWGNNGNSDRLESLLTGTAAMKVKDTCSLEEKL